MVSSSRIFALLSGIFFFFVSATEFFDLWYQMQQQYLRIQGHIEQRYVHNYWTSTLSQIKRHILGNSNQNFLHIPQIAGTMVRSGRGPMQEYELNYLRTNPSHRTSLYQDTKFGGTRAEIAVDASKHWSSSTLGHIFYIERILKYYTREPEIILEIGGGYGNLARLFKQIAPDSIYIIIDAPEVLALQWLFLKGSTDYHVELCDHIPSFTKAGIYLIPNSLLNHLSIKPSIFISNFALSECAFEMQKDIALKNFYDAQFVYLTGQMSNKWPEGWVDHNFLLSATRQMYSKVMMEPFQEGQSNDHSYELIAF